MGVPCCPGRMVACSNGVDLQIVETSTFGKQVEQSIVGWATRVGSVGACWGEDAPRLEEGYVIVGGTGNSVGSSIVDRCIMEFWILICLPVLEPTSILRHMG